MSRDISSFAELNALKLQLARAPKVAEKIAQRAAARLTELAREAFAARQGVYGTPYGKGADGKPIDLHETGALQNKATQYKATGTKITASVAAVRYAKYQLKRGFLPRKGYLPAAWEAEIAKIVSEELKKHFGG